MGETKSIGESRETKVTAMTLTNIFSNNSKVFFYCTILIG